MADRAATAAREEADAWSALSRFLRECVLAGVGAFASSVEPAVHARIQADPSLTQARTVVSELIARLTAQAHADGALRPDITPADLARMMTLQIYIRPDEDHPAAVHRLIDVLMDGMRVRYS
ncbi:SbtR family transcriptional regulator [Nocardia sp. NBC_01730]|uniref:SbtR family transcriptional regulator n=1 Tax=Nocardia sp. NBC_01730 TaxID=2975998 RepID=UPI002E11DEEC